MGLLTAQITKHQLRQEKLDLQYKCQQITTARRNLSKSTDDLTQVGTEYDGDSPIAKTLEQRKAKLKLLEQKLDAQMEEYQDRLKMIDTEIQSAQGMFDNEVKEAFKY